MKKITMKIKIPIHAALKNPPAKRLMIDNFAFLSGEENDFNIKENNIWKMKGAMIVVNEK